MSVIRKRERRVHKLNAEASQILSFPIERVRDGALKPGSDITFGISLRASSEGFPNVDLGIIKKQIPVKTLADGVGTDHIPMLFQIGQSLSPKEPELFQGRGHILARIQRSFHGGVQRERYFLDGIRRVGKTSILNFMPQYLPEALVPVLVTFDTVGLRGAIDSAAMLRHFCSMIARAVTASGGPEIAVPDPVVFAGDPGEAFGAFLDTFESILPGRIPFLMIDEFQDLLTAISRSGSGEDRNTLVLDQMRGHLDDGRISAIFTGSVRFDRLSRIIDHRIFGALTRLRVSFLSEESVGSVIRAGLRQWATVSTETIKRIQALTGGYPWLVQKYGADLVNLLNRESRTVAAPDDIDLMTNDAVLCNNELFQYWWPTDQLRAEEERFVETLLRKFPSEQTVSTHEFLSTIHTTQQAAFRRAFENLRACEVLDSTQANVLQFSGAVLRRWLEQHLQDGQLKLPKAAIAEDRGQAGIVIDHENLVRSLERVSLARGIAVPSDKLDWFAPILGHLVTETERRLGPQIPHKVTVAFWTRPHEARLLSAYFAHGFTPAQPESVKLENAVDFKVADEVRRARERAMREGTTLRRVSSQATVISRTQCVPW
jgi:hypothetical protein